MLKIRLARIGKKKKPAYRFIVSEAGRDTFGKALEILGHYNPFTKICEVKKDRILYWISKGAKASPTVHNLLVVQNVITEPKVKASKTGNKSDGQKSKGEAETVKPEEAKPTEKAKPEESQTEEKPKVEAAKEEARKEEKPEVKEKKPEKKPTDKITENAAENVKVKSE